MNVAREKRVRVCRLKQWEDKRLGDFDVKLTDWIGFLQDKLATVPAEYRDQVRCELAVDGPGYDGEYTSTLHIYYDRPETAEETAARELIEQHNRADEVRRLETQLERLKAEK